MNFLFFFINKMMLKLSTASLHTSMASGINIYSQLLISTVRIVDINN